MKSKLGDRQRIVHILQSIQEIKNYTLGVDFETFLLNSMMRFAVIKQIEIIGEAANYLTPSLCDSNPHIHWREIIGLRHILVHEYFGIDDTLIWQLFPKT